MQIKAGVVRVGDLEELAGGLVGLKSLREQAEQLQIGREEPTPEVSKSRCTRSQQEDAAIALNPVPRHSGKTGR